MSKAETGDSIPQFKILILIAQGTNYSTAISKTLKLNNSGIVQALNRIVKTDLIISKKEQLLNKTIYEVNWETLAQKYQLKLKNDIKGQIVHYANVEETTFKELYKNCIDEIVKEHNYSNFKKEEFENFEKLFKETTTKEYLINVFKVVLPRFDWTINITLNQFFQLLSECFRDYTSDTNIERNFQRILALLEFAGNPMETIAFGKICEAFDVLFSNNSQEMLVKVKRKLFKSQDKNTTEGV